MLNIVFSKVGTLLTVFFILHNLAVKFLMLFNVVIQHEKSLKVNSLVFTVAAICKEVATQSIKIAEIESNGKTHYKT